MRDCIFFKWDTILRTIMCSAFFCLPAQKMFAAGTIIKIITSKNSAIAAFQEVEEVPEKGTKICFQTLTDNISICGKIAKILGKKALVVFGKKDFSSVAFSMTETPATKGASKKEASRPNPTIFRLLYTPHLMSHVTFSLPTYQAPANASGNTSNLWGSGDKITSSFFVMGGELYLSKISLATGIRYKSYSSQTILTDYVKGQAQPYLKSTLAASAIGLWGDYIYATPRLSEKTFFPLTAGLDIEMSSLSFQSSTQSDQAGATTQDVATASSSLTAVALRTGAGVETPLFSSITLGARLNFLLPLTTLNRKASATVPDSNAASGTKEQDLIDAIAHKAGGLGVEIGISLGVMF